MLRAKPITWGGPFVVRSGYLLDTATALEIRDAWASYEVPGSPGCLNLAKVVDMGPDTVGPMSLTRDEVRRAFASILPGHLAGDALEPEHATSERLRELATYTLPGW